MGMQWTTVEYGAFNEALNRLLNPKMPSVVYRKDDKLAMANDAIKALMDEMKEICFLLKQGQDDAKGKSAQP